MEQAPIPAGPVTPERRMGVGKILLLTLLVAVIASAATVWVMTRYLFPKELTPVRLSDREAAVLEQKLERIDPTARRAADPAAGAAGGTLQPERYSEAGAQREISFSTREVNALVAKNNDLAQRFAIDLSKNMASAKLLIPLDPDFPILGGNTLKVTAGLELRHVGSKPVVALTGVSVWGVPIPNAWLGGLKHVDLVGEFGGDPGFWSSLAAGIEDIRVDDGKITIKLKE
jgi:hypothetical protein